MVLIKKFFALPLLVLFQFASEKQSIRADIEWWIEITRKERIGRGELGNLLTLLAEFQQYRNLFYHRLRQGNGLEALAAEIARLFYRESPSLRIMGSCSIGPGLFSQHGWNTGMDAEIGHHCWINQNVTLGYIDDSGRRPSIGNHVQIGVGAVVLGGVSVGDNVRVGANAVIVKDVPPNCVVVGVPARIVKRDGVRVSENL